MMESKLHSYKIPEQPGIMREVREANGDINTIAEAIANHEHLTEEVLDTVNSPCFNLVRRIQFIDEAARFLGSDRITNLTCSRLIYNVLHHDIPKMDAFWSCAGNVAICAVLLNKELDRVSDDEAYMLGLFSKCGMPLLMQGDRKQYIKAVREGYAAEHGHVTRYEERDLSTDHAQVGYELAIKWQLPETICNIIRHQHDIEFITRTFSQGRSELGDFLLILKVAERVCRVHGYIGGSRTDFQWPQICEHLMSYIDLADFEYERLERQVRTKLNELNH